MISLHPIIWHDLTYYNEGTTLFNAKCVFKRLGYRSVHPDIRRYEEQEFM